MTGKPDPYIKVLEKRVVALETLLTRTQAAEREQRLRADLLERTTRAAWASTILPPRRRDDGGP